VIEHGPLQQITTGIHMSSDLGLVVKIVKVLKTALDYLHIT